MNTRNISSEDFACRSKSSIGQSLFERRLSGSSSKASIATSRSVSLSEKKAVPNFSTFISINETDRLVSDQGLITPKQRNSGSLRKVRDKSYYKGVIRLKGKEISDEMKKLQKEIGLLNMDSSSYLPYKKKAESKAMELENLQNLLANYNLVDDMFHSDILLDEAVEQFEKLKVQNTEENAEVEKLFQLTKQREMIIKELQTDLNQEKYVSEILTSTVNRQVYEKYIKLKRQDDELQCAWFDYQKEIEKLNNVKDSLENHLSKMKQSEASQLLRKLEALEDKKNALFSERTFTSLSEEKEYFEKYAVECNDLMRNVIQQTRNLEDKIKLTKEELKEKENEVLYPFSERAEKYAKLKKREKVIDDFLSSYSNRQLIALSERKQFESDIPNLLEEISNKLIYFNPRLAVSENSQNENTEKTTENVETLRLKILKLSMDLNEVDSRVKTSKQELTNVKDTIEETENEITTYSDIENVERDMLLKENELITEKEKLQKQKRTLELIIDDLRKQHDSLKNKLNNNQTYRALSKLEKRWHSLEQENFSMKSFIDSKKFETNYLPVKENVRKLYSELNLML